MGFFKLCSLKKKIRCKSIIYLMCWVKTTYTLYYEILAISCLETTYINTTMTINTNLLKDTSSWYLSNEQISKLSAVLQSCLPLQYHIDKIFSHEQYSIFFLPLLAITMHSVLECHKLTLICLQKIICTQTPQNLSVVYTHQIKNVVTYASTYLLQIYSYNYSYIVCLYT